MLVRFKPSVNLKDVGKLTERCDSIGVRYKYIQELSTSYLVVESNEQAKLEELYHQFRHMPFVASVSYSRDPEDPLTKLEPVSFRLGSRWVGRGSRPVLIAGSPYLESQKHSLLLATELANIGVNIYKAGPYRPMETLPPKALYERTGTIVQDISKKSGIPSTGMVEALGPKVSLMQLQPCAYHVPGEFLFETNLKEQLGQLGVPVLLERHPDASTELWLKAATEIVTGGNRNVALVETGRMVGDRREIDIVEVARLVDTCPLPVMVYPSRAAETAEAVGRIARASLAAGVSGILLDVHPNPLEGLLTDGYCLSLEVFREMFQSLKLLMV